MRNLVAIAALVIAVAGCSPPPGRDGALRVAVSIPPQREIVERVGGEAVALQVLIPPGASPATFTLAPQQLASLIQADQVFIIGVPFDRTLQRRLDALAPDLPVADMAAGVNRVPIDGHHHDGGTHHHGEQLDPHVWLDPVRVRELVETTRSVLCRRAPESCPEFTARAEAYTAELVALDATLREMLAPCSGHAVAVFHPAYGYLLRRYQMVQRAIEVEGKDPTPRQLADLVADPEMDRLTAILVQPQFASRSAEAAAAALGVDIVELDPLAADLVANLERMGRVISSRCPGNTGLN